MHSFQPCDLSAEPSAIRQLTPEQKDRLTDILDRYLSSLAAGVPAARETLLESHPDLAGPLEVYLKGLDELHDMAAGFGGPSHPPEPEPETPESEERRLGDFRLLREIGRGGMGVVYEARQISLGRRVALKVLPFAAVLDSRQIARFKHEAQAAAQLNHPNIVPVFAVGVERGVHYYAMQFIEGQPLDRAIAELRRARPSPGMTCEDDADETPAEGDSAEADAPEVDVCPSTQSSLLTERSANPSEYVHTVVRLGIQAAEALHAAHEGGIIHRDVKPSNLLIDGDGNLWVTDFGLARCQTDVTVTRTGDLIGTLRYMSPEQASGQSAMVDHRTDVYSLGATLYEMLALRPAFPGDEGAVLVRRIEQEEPAHLRQSQPRVPVDLETVIEKAMAKRRDERYATAREFAEDLRRVLEGKPTIARPPSLPDRVGKWARRHRRVVAAAVAVGLLAVLGMAASTVLILREKAKTEHNYALAEQHFREAREVVDRLGIQLAERLAHVPGADEVRRDLLLQTLQYYRNFVSQAQDDPALRSDLALAYGKSGTLSAEIGSNDEAIQAHTNAIGLLRQLAEENPREPDYRRRLALSQNHLALALSRSGRTDAARSAYREAIRLQEELVARDAGDGSYTGDLALSHTNLGLLQSETGQVKEAEASFAEAIRLQERLLGLEPGNPERLRNLAASLNNLGALYVGREPRRAVELYQKALAYQTKAASVRPAELKYRSDVALTQNNLGAVLSRSGALAEAAASYGRAVESQRELVRASPAQKSYRHDLAVSYNNLGLTQSGLRQAPEAEKSFRQALDLQEALVRQNPGDLDLHSSLGGIYNNLAIVQEELRRPADAAASYRRAIEHQKTAQSQAPKVSRYRVFLSKHYFNYGRVLRRLGRPEEAAHAALARRALWPNDPQHLVAVAEELAGATKLLAGSKGTEMSADRCADYAVETLKQAMASGWKPTTDDWTQSFAALEGYPAFAALVKR